MQHYIRILIIICITAFESQAQSEMSLAEYNAAVYRLSLSGSWDSVMHYCRKAELDGLQSYELTFSKGKALFHTGQYRNAYMELVSLEDMGSASSDVTSYLYYSAKYGGLEPQSRYQRSKLTGADRKKYGINPIPVIDAIQISGSYNASSNVNENGVIEFYPPEPITFDSAWYKMTGDNQLATLAADFSLAPRAGLFVSVQTLETSDLFRLAYIDYPGAPLSYVNAASETKQQSVYAAIPLLISKRSSIIPAMHLIKVSTENISSGSYPGEILKSDTTFTEKLLSLAWVTDRAAWTRSLSFSWSDFSFTHQLQLTFNQTWFPQSNLNEYYTLRASIQRDGKQGGFSAGLSGGWKLLNPLWLEAGFDAGKRSDFNEKNGWLIYNISDDQLFSLTISPIFLFGKHLHITLQYKAIFNRLPITLRSENNSQRPYRSSSTIETNYFINHLTGGILWKL